MARRVTYAYACSDGRHEVLATPRPLDRCPVYVDGRPCTGTLRQTAGPRKKKQ